MNIDVISLVIEFGRCLEMRECFVGLVLLRSQNQHMHASFVIAMCVPMWILLF